LDAAIAALDIAEKVSSIAQAKVVFGIVKEVLTMVKVGFTIHVGGSWAKMRIGHYDER